MDHIALDGAWPHDRHLDHQIVKFLRFKPRQHRHLGPALDLEDAHGISVREHLVDRRILLRDVGHVGDADLIHGLLDGREHAQRQDIHLHQAERIDVVLVPLDEGAVLHGGVADGNGLVEPPLGEDEAADMLGKVAGKTEQLGGQGHGAGDPRIFRIQPGLADMSLGEIVTPASPDRAG